MTTEAGSEAVRVLKSATKNAALSYATARAYGATGDIEPIRLSGEHDGFAIFERLLERLLALVAAEASEAT